MKKPTDGPDFLDWALKAKTKEEKEKEKEERLRKLLIAQGKHINKYKS